MGYHSEIVCVMQNNAFQEFKSCLDILECNILDEASLETDGDNDDCEVTITYEQIKWYDTYEDVDIFNKTLQTLNDLSYGFLRLGEDVGDVEMLGDTYRYGLYVDQRISRM
jgi:hypothetical protein